MTRRLAIICRDCVEAGKAPVIAYAERCGDQWSIRHSRPPHNELWVQRAIEEEEADTSLEGVTLTPEFRATVMARLEEQNVAVPQTFHVSGAPGALFNVFCQHHEPSLLIVGDLDRAAALRAKQVTTRSRRSP